jgi:quinol monooxygenase YgiN
MAELQVIARYMITAGMQEEVLPLLTKLAEASRTEPGNVSFEIYRRYADERNVVLLERYSSPDALIAHRETPHFKGLVLEQIVPRLDSRVVESFLVD